MLLLCGVPSNKFELQKVAIERKRTDARQNTERREKSGCRNP